MATVYKIVSRSEWHAALAAGEFRGSELDLRDGFIHFSSAEQVAETLRKYYAGRDDLILLYVRLDALTSPACWKWEPSRDAALFPHLYGTLPVTAVHREELLALLPTGEHQRPDFDA